MNEVLFVSVITVVIAQCLKVPIYYIKNKQWKISIAFSTGSMPSSHTAFVVSLATSIGIVEGVDTSIYALSVVFAMIIIHDAIKVRGESGKQAVVLNDLNESVSEIRKLINIKNTKEMRENKLKELIGHTLNEVIGGIILGLIIPVISFELFNFVV